MPISVDQFVQSVSQSGLISAADLKAFLASLPPSRRPPNGDSFAQLLVQSGKLTRYQAAAVAQGKAKNLVYVVQTTTGQETLTTDEFPKKYGWKNDPAKALRPIEPVKNAK